jgi:small-conductance mechanosensitive channel
MPETQFVTAWQVVTDYANAFLKHLPVIAVAAVILVVSWLLAKLAKSMVRRFASRFIDDPSLLSLFGTISYVVTLGFGAFAAAATVFPGLKAGDLIAVLGLSSVAVGFAFKDIFENFLAGVLILSRRPFKIGDEIEVDGVTGRVGEISFRSTEIHTYTNEIVVIPNANLFKNAVTVRTADDKRRSSFAAGIAYDEDIETARDVIRDAVSGCDEVLEDPQPAVLCWSHDASAIAFEVRYWTRSSIGNVVRGRDQVATAIKYGLDEAGIEIPYPHLTLDYPGPAAFAEKMAG